MSSAAQRGALSRRVSVWWRLSEPATDDRMVSPVLLIEHSTQSDEITLFLYWCTVDWTVLIYANVSVCLLWTGRVARVCWDLQFQSDMIQTWKLLLSCGCFCFVQVHVRFWRFSCLPVAHRGAWMESTARIGAFRWSSTQTSMLFSQKTRAGDCGPPKTCPRKYIR